MKILKRFLVGTMLIIILSTWFIWFAFYWIFTGNDPMEVINRFYDWAKKINVF